MWLPNESPRYVKNIADSSGATRHLIVCIKPRYHHAPRSLNTELSSKRPKDDGWNATPRHASCIRSLIMPRRCRLINVRTTTTTTDQKKVFGLVANESKPPSGDEGG